MTYTNYTMKYFLIVHLVIIGNLSSHPEISLEYLHTHDSRYPTESALYSYDLINGSSVNGFQRDYLMNSNDDPEIEFMKMFPICKYCMQLVKTVLQIAFIVLPPGRPGSHHRAQGGWGGPFKLLF